MFSFLLLVIFISFDTSILMFENGESIETFNVKEAIAHSLIFAVIATIMLLLGDYVVSLLYHEHLIRATRFLKSVILIVKAVTLLFEGLFHKKFPHHDKKHFSIKTSLEDAVIAGIDMLLLALCIFYAHIPIGVQCLSVFLIMAIQVMASLYIGYTKGHKYTKMICYLCFFAYMAYGAIHIQELFLHH